jgi:hypothetical protein
MLLNVVINKRKDHSWANEDEHHEARRMITTFLYYEILIKEKSILSIYNFVNSILKIPKNR